MEKITLYRITVAGLLLLNLVLVAFLWFGRPNAGPPPFRAVERFDLSEEQSKQFFKSAGAHRATMRQVNGEQRDVLREYFKTLKVPANNTPIPVPPEVLRLEEQKVQATYDHFLAVKGLLNPEQRNEYPSFIDYVIERVVEKGQRKPPPQRSEKKSGPKD
ncbi:MAG: hypothetical protein OTI34_05495 [Lewinella sp.]|nr:hypothetical protein [Lewinella sp.]